MTPGPPVSVVGSSLDDEWLGGLDLRDRDEQAAPGKIDLRDGVRGIGQRHATVLLAQYGLPLVAFDASQS
jgi:hypothetical protein